MAHRIYSSGAKKAGTSHNGVRYFVNETADARQKVMKRVHLRKLAREADAGETVNLTGRTRAEIRKLLFG